MDNILHFKSDFEADLIDKIKAETQHIGYYNLPQQNTDYIDNYLLKLNQIQNIDSIKDVVVVGVGGSSLGTKAVYQFIKPIKNLARNLHFLEGTDPISIQSLCANLNWHATHFVIVSKSGTTIETIAAYKYLLHWVGKAGLDFYPFTFITDPKSPLEAHALASNGIVVNIEANIGGRFSVLSAVGLIPLSLAGVDIRQLLQGADKIKNSFFKAGKIKQTLLEKATFYAKNSTNYNINALFSYSDSLQYFNQWYVQLWSESLGKRQKNSAFNIGLTPIGLTGPKDQHSFLQLLTEGTRDKTVTFIKLKNFSSTPHIPNISLRNLEALDLLNNIKFSTLINLQADAIIQSLKNYKRIPLDEITLNKQDEFSIGGLIYYYELLTSLMGNLLNINTYNQPGVESGKQILLQKLKKTQS